LGNHNQRSSPGLNLATIIVLIYINDLPYELYHTGKPVTYADDTSVLTTAKNINELQIKAESTVDYMSERFLLNGLSLNIDKTNRVEFSSKYYQDEKFLMNESTNTKLQLDKHKNWKNHNNKILPKQRSTCFVVRIE